MAKNAVATGTSVLKPPPGKVAAESPCPGADRQRAGAQATARPGPRARLRHPRRDQRRPARGGDPSPDQLDELIAMFEDMGVSVNRDEDGGNGNGAAKTDLEGGDDEPESAAAIDEEDLGRTDDPVRMYLREMGTIELLSREGEIEIAKRIEAGRNTVLEALCESPLTMRAIISWRDQIGEGKVLLRDVIDLEATYGGAEPQAEDAAPPSRPTPSPPRPRASRPGPSPSRRSPRAKTRTTSTRARCRSRPWRRRSGTACSRPSTGSPRAMSGCAACRSSGSRTCSTTSRSRPSSTCATSRRAARWSSWSTRSTSTPTGSSTWSSSCTRSTGA